MKVRKSKYRPLAIILAVLMFLTSSNLPIDFHYCQGKLKSFSFFGKASNCHEMARNAMACPHHQKIDSNGDACAEEEKGCCQNKLIHLHADHVKQIQPSGSANELLEYQVLSASFLLTNNSLPVLKDNSSNFNFYRPPLILRDIAVLYQSFLL